MAVLVAGVAAVGLVRGASGQGTETTTIEGRTAASVPAGPNDSIIAADGGVPLYETQRIKRTPPLDPATGLDGNWDALYTVKDGVGFRTSYFDWDSENLYLGVEMPEPAAARFDLDLKDDGWLRGADNLTFYVSPTCRRSEQWNPEVRGVPIRYRPESRPARVGNGPDSAFRDSDTGRADAARDVCGRDCRCPNRGYGPGTKARRATRRPAVREGICPTRQANRER